MIIPVAGELDPAPTTEQFLQPQLAQAISDIWSEIKLLNQGTAEHCARVGYLNWLMVHCAVEGGYLPASYDPRIGAVAGLLHDTGKIHSEVRVHLHSDDYFSQTNIQEFPERAGQLDALKSGHCKYGPIIIEEMGLRGLHEDIYLAARQHHMDLTDANPGYPERNPGEEVSPIARITAVADRFDAMLAGKRGYCRPKTPEEAKAHILDLMTEGKLDRSLQPVFDQVYNLYISQNRQVLSVGRIANCLENIMGLTTGSLMIEG